MNLLKIVILFLAVIIFNSCLEKKIEYTEYVFGGKENLKFIQDSEKILLSVVFKPPIKPDKYARENPGEPLPDIDFGIEKYIITAGPVLVSKSDMELLKRIVLLDSSYLYGENVGSRLCYAIYSLRADFITNNEIITLMIDLQTNQMGVYKDGVDINDAVICYIDKIHDVITNIYSNAFPAQTLSIAYQNGGCR